MSVINDMLKDLEQRGDRAAAGRGATLEGLRPVSGESAGRRRLWIPLLVGAVVLAGGAGFYAWTAGMPDPDPEPVETAPASAEAPSSPPAEQTSPEPEAAKPPGFARITTHARPDGLRIDWVFDRESATPPRLTRDGKRLLLEVAVSPDDPALVDALEATQAVIALDRGDPADGEQRLDITLARAVETAGLASPGPRHWRLDLAFAAPAEAEPTAQPADSSRVQPAEQNQATRPESKETTQAPVPEPEPVAEPDPAPEADAPSVRQAPQRPGLAEIRGWVDAGRLERARSVLEKRVEQDGDIETALLFTEVLIRQNRPAEARAAIRRVLAADPGNARAVTLFGRLLVGEGSHAEAVRLLEAQPDPRPEQLALLGTALRKQGRHIEASQAYHRALQARPDEAGWWVGLGVSLENADHPRQALAAYRRAVSLPGLVNRAERFARDRIRRLQDRPGKEASAAGVVK